MNRKSYSRLAIIAPLILFASVGCNLSKSELHPTETGTPATLPTSPVITQSLSTGLSVQITGPAANAQLAVGVPLQVVFTASGGPFLEFDLSVDGTNVATTSSTGSETQVSSSLQWTAPTQGSHTLVLMAVDLNKNIASAQIQVQVGVANTPVTDTPAAGSTQANGFQIRFTNITDGGTINAQLDSDGKQVVIIKFEVTGLAPIIVDMLANDVNMPEQSRNPTGQVPFKGEIKWTPLNGGGQYTLVANATSNDKQSAQATVHVTVTGLPVFTPTPPPLDQAAARLRFTQLFKQLDGIDIPAPSIERFNFPHSPTYSRWISSVYYKGQRYYIELYDDTHYVADPTIPYSDPAHRVNNSSFILCRPAGHYKILVVYVDYGNLTVDKSNALAQVPIFANWTNELYTKFAKTHGFSSSPLSIEADAAWISSPPSPGNLLTSAQILAGTGVDPKKYDIVIQIDLDANNTAGLKNWPGILDQGGGVALQGCGAYSKTGDVNIWSVVMQTQGTQSFVNGNLSMDFNHELSHLFGMLDNWPFSPGSINSPDGALHDDWITYINFGWTDTDGDGIPEIIDPTPYGTSGPQP